MRKPTDTAHINLRIRERLRAKLAAEAERNRVSMNAEILRRLEESFETKDLATIAERLRESVTQLKIARQLLATREPMQ
jgi:hypothetical protein